MCGLKIPPGSPEIVGPDRECVQCVRIAYKGKSYAARRFRYERLRWAPIEPHRYELPDPERVA